MLGRALAMVWVSKEDMLMTQLANFGKLRSFPNGRILCMPRGLINEI